MTTVRQGSCLCGNVTYTVTGPSTTSTVCHCANCQKFSGSAFAANALYKKDQFKLLSGADSLKVFIDTAVASGNVLQRNFCANCGSSLFIERHKPDDTQNIFALMTGCIDGDKASFRPVREHFGDARYPCVSIEMGAGGF